MSMLFRRSLSTLIPPKVVSAKQLGNAPNAKRVANMVSFYKSLPQGSAPAAQGKGVINWYKAKYFNGDKASGKPLLHLVFGLATLGYSLEYYFHLRHHKGGEEEH
ncbi:ATP synthase f chain, mitochondrial precursor [Maudiozyma exigua]|uniref:ATP synthase f chain, mitochondrial n=1 Tax=Maudiozyma exigua TaxID=34358 RepID=A0A9P6W7P0_MAUEX|nr:ATP synthase f chain, mitochondrial precursor [Kazachstania exigua]